VSPIAAIARVEKQSEPDGVGVGVCVCVGVWVVLPGSKVTLGFVVYAQLFGGFVAMDSENVDPLQTQYGVWIRVGDVSPMRAGKLLPCVRCLMDSPIYPSQGPCFDGYTQCRMEGV
jgi:hypothetical protein